jgi:hypothetical protein
MASVGPWFKVGTDILSDPEFILMRKDDRLRYLELCALAKLSMDHVCSDEEIGTLLSGPGKPMTMRAISAQLREPEDVIDAFLLRAEEEMPGSVERLSCGGVYLAKFAERQYSRQSMLPDATRKRVQSYRERQDELLKRECNADVTRKKREKNKKKRECTVSESASASVPEGGVGGETKPPTEAEKCIQVYQRAFAEYCGTEPSRPSKEECIILNKKLAEAKDDPHWPKKIRAVIKYYASGEDEYWTKQGTIPTLFVLLQKRWFDPALAKIARQLSEKPPAHHD